MNLRTRLNSFNAPAGLRISVCVVGLLLLVSASLLADEKYSALGADSCLPCHGEGQPLDASPIFNTAHGSDKDSRSPFAGQQCEACHGPSRPHVDASQRGDVVPPAIVFGEGFKTDVNEQNAVCLECHESDGRLGWPESAHDASEVGCASCHRVHSSEDPPSDSESQQTMCVQCHPKRRADLHKPSSHPLRLGGMSCSDCHDVHNGNHDFLLNRESLNETCFDCHAEKRGPFLWEHAPASEDCSLCHQSHGSNHNSLLTRRPPWLCQQCHSPAGHPGLEFAPESAADASRNRFLLGRSCLNCHSQVHGSNHPSGSTLHR